MSIPQIKATQLSNAGPGAPVVIAGPSLGTSGSALWRTTAAALTGFTVLAWDLPGHGVSPAAAAAFSLEELAAAVHALVENAVSAGDVAASAELYYAGVSLGGAVGLQLGLDYPTTFTKLAILCSGAKIGEAEGWEERAATVRTQGTPAVLIGSAQRWFADGFIDREKEASAALLHSLQDADRFSYAFCCQALAAFDVRDRLAEIPAPVLAIAGSEDVVTPESFAELIAAGVPNGRSAVVSNAAHLVPAEQPAAAAELLRGFFAAANEEG